MVSPVRTCPATTMTLCLRSVTHRYGSQTVLDDVSLHVRAGDLYGFLGHNGAGKTTAMRIALGLVRPKSGHVTIDGFDIRRYPLEARARLGALIEAPGFYRSLDGARNLVLLARLQGMSRASAARETARLLELVGLDGVGAKPVGSYSQGMRQRLGVAQAILGRPKVVLLDEPMNGLDPEGIREMRDLLVRLTRDEGMTVLLSSHQLREISDVCNRIAVIRKGKLLVEDTTERLLAEGERRLRLRTSDLAKTAGVLDRLGVSHTHDASEVLVAEIDSVAPERIAKAVVEAGIGLHELSPTPPSLEDVYLRYTRDGNPTDGKSPIAMRTAKSPSRAENRAETTRVAATRPDALPAITKDLPDERIAPAWPLLRMVRHEFSRWSSYVAVPFAMALPAVLAVLAVFRRKLEASANAAKIEDADVASTTAVTAFEGVGVGLAAGLPLLAIILAGLASQSIAGGLSRGTLRNILLRPVTRFQVAAGKGLSLLFIGLLGFSCLAGASIGVAASVFEFTDVFEILPNGEAFPFVEASELWPELRRVLIVPLLPLASFAAIGFLAGALARNGTVALGLGLGSVVFLELARVVAREYGIEGWLPTAHWASPLSDVSFVRYYDQVVQGISNVEWRYADQSILAPLLWIVVPFAVSVFCLKRRAIP